MNQKHEFKRRKYVSATSKIVSYSFLYQQIMQLSVNQSKFNKTLHGVKAIKVNTLKEGWVVERVLVVVNSCQLKMKMKTHLISVKIFSFGKYCESVCWIFQIYTSIMVQKIFRFMAYDTIDNRVKICFIQPLSQN